ncbi:MAG: hypothetical protein ACKO6C_03135, partial [Alphaproteobacteria bacterium]
FANSATQALDPEQFMAGVAYEAKLFQKRLEGTEIQYLVAINATMGPSNFDEIIEYNKNPEMTSARAKDQVGKIYSPLLKGENGEKFSDQQIIENLQRVRNFNCSYGTVTANLQENALKKFMQDLGIKDEVVKQAMT